MKPPEPCVTVDVEDFADGMRALGCIVAPSSRAEPGLRTLVQTLERRTAHVTLFVVGRQAASAGHSLRMLADAGHEIASHGPDHGSVPSEHHTLIDWLVRGREMVEDAIGRPVRGFRSPRFDVPAVLGLRTFRDAIAAAGFAYVSDTSLLGPDSPIVEFPVGSRWGIRLGAGSYQRLFPRRLVPTLIRPLPPPAVLAYHSYDFGRELPPLRSARSALVVSQVLGRSRVAPIFDMLIDQFGSRTCSEALSALR